MAAVKMRKIELTRSVVIAGHGHCEAGDTFEVTANTAAHLVGADCAQYVDDEPHPNREGYVTRVVTPEDGDPVPRKIAPKPKTTKPE